MGIADRNWSSSELVSVTPVPRTRSICVRVIRASTAYDEVAVRRLLDAALVSDAEFLAGPTEWETYDDPFDIHEYESDDEGEGMRDKDHAITDLTEAVAHVHDDTCIHTEEAEGPRRCTIVRHIESRWTVAPRE
jgi:hypothetical protein